MITMIIMLCFLTIVNTYPRLSSTRKYVRNLNKAINNNCNLFALNSTNNTVIYECMKNSNDNCTLLTNFSEYISIKKECVKSCENGCGCGILITGIAWVLIWVFSQYN